MKRKIDTLEVLKTAMKDNDYSYDIYFRMAVIDEHIHGNEDIWVLYNKMQKLRCNMIKEVPKEMMNHKKEFIELINSFQLNGYNMKNPILVNKDGLIIDGAHRMACSVYFNIPFVTITSIAEYSNIVPANYSREWFIKNKLYDCISFGDIQYNKVKEKLKCINLKRY